MLPVEKTKRVAKGFSDFFYKISYFQVFFGVPIFFGNPVKNSHSQ